MLRPTVVGFLGQERAKSVSAMTMQSFVFEQVLLQFQRNLKTPKPCKETTKVFGSGGSARKEHGLHSPQKFSNFGLYGSS